MPHGRRGERRVRHSGGLLGLVYSLKTSLSPTRRDSRKPAGPAEPVAPAAVRDEPTYDLEFHGLALELNGADLEVYADSANVALGVGVVCEPEEET